MTSEAALGRGARSDVVDQGSFLQVYALKVHGLSGPSFLGDYCGEERTPSCHSQARLSSRSTWETGLRNCTILDGERGGVGYMEQSIIQLVRLVDRRVYEGCATYISSTMGVVSGLDWTERTTDFGLQRSISQILGKSVCVEAS